MARFMNQRHYRPKTAKKNGQERQRLESVVNFDGNDIHIGQMNAGHKVIRSTLRYADESCSANVGGRIEPSLDEDFKRICAEYEWSRSKGLQQALIFFVTVAPRVDCGKLVRHMDKLLPILDALE